MIDSRSDPVTSQVQVGAMVLNKHVDHMKAANSHAVQEQNMPCSSEQSERLPEHMESPFSSNVDETSESEMGMADVATLKPLPVQEERAYVYQLEDAQVYSGIPSVHPLPGKNFTLAPGSHITPKFLYPTMPLLLIFGHTGVGRLEDLLMGLHLDLARLAINRSMQWAGQGVISVNYMPFFRGYVRTRVSSEKEHAVSTKTLN
eukprot:g42790.t1